MKTHKIKQIYFKSKRPGRQIVIELTNWFDIRQFGWNLQGYNNHVYGLQIGWLQICVTRKGRPYRDWS